MATARSWPGSTSPSRNDDLPSSTTAIGGTTRGGTRPTNGAASASAGSVGGWNRLEGGPPPRQHACPGAPGRRRRPRAEGSSACRSERLTCASARRGTNCTGEGGYGCSKISFV
jgi:hypothetical protein